MKTVIKFQSAALVRMLDTRYELDQVLNSCQSEANKAPAREGETKRSAFNPKAKGAEIHWKESTALEYAAQANNPLRMVAWTDAIAKLEKTHGQPSGEYTPEMIPDGLKIWLETKFLKASADDTKPEDTKGKDGSRNGKGNVGKVPTPEPAK